jgi:hypothetical protein
MFPPEHMKLAAFLLVDFDSYQPVRSIPATSTKPGSSFTVAHVKSEFQPAKDNELSLIPGERVIVLKAIDEEWWGGINSTGESGRFPRICVEIHKDDEPPLEDTVGAPPAKDYSQRTEGRLFSSY